MNFSLPTNDDQTRIKVVKKEELAARKEAKKSFFGAAPTGAPGSGPASAEGARPLASHLTPGAPGSAGASLPNGVPGAPGQASKTTDPKVQLVEVEPGIYDIYFTCACCEQYIIRCESLDKAAAAPIPTS